MESRRMRSRSQILKWVCYAVALFVCAALQTTPGLLQLGQAKPLFILRCVWLWPCMKASLQVRCLVP